MTEMQALFYHGRRDLRLERIPRPEPGPGEVLIKVTDAGLSQTQINEFMEGPFIMNAYPHPRTGLGLPIIPCQEYGGTISAVGPDVDPGLIGQVAAVLPLDACGRCTPCISRRPNLCETLVYRGLTGAHGGFCEYSVVPQKAIFEVGRKDLLTFVEPLLVGMHSLHRMQRPVAGARVLVIGAGAVGCALASIWQQVGGAHVMVHDRLDERVARCVNMGLQASSDLDGAELFDVVVDAAGKDPLAAHQALEIAYDFCRHGGTVINVGVYFSPVAIVPANQIVAEKTSLPSFAYDEADVVALRAALPMTTFRFDPLIKRLALDELIEHGYYEAELDKSGFTRIVCSAYE